MRACVCSNCVWCVEACFASTNIPLWMIELFLVYSSFASFFMLQPDCFYALMRARSLACWFYAASASHFIDAVLFAAAAVNQLRGETFSFEFKLVGFAVSWACIFFLLTLRVIESVAHHLLVGAFFQTIFRGFCITRAALLNWRRLSDTVVKGTGMLVELVSRIRKIPWTYDISLEIWSSYVRYYETCNGFQLVRCLYRWSLLM